jgi:transcriptional regulator with XRE-family HTH domain
MQRYASLVPGRVVVRLRDNHRRQSHHPWHRRPTNRTYRERVAISRDVARANFAQFVARALAAARSRGMTDADISAATGVGPSTFHRWRRGEWGRGWPELQSVIDFCEGLDIDPQEGFTALGLSGQRQPTVEQPLDPDLKLLARRLSDPNTSTAEKATIRATLQYLANLPEEPPGRRRRAG